MRTCRLSPSHLSFLVFPLLVLLAGAALSSCAPAAPTPVGTITAQLGSPTPASTPDLAALHPEIWAAWQAGPHAAAYDLGKGPNTFCARCHSPRNWDPAAHTDPPPNCVSCKFPFDAEVRQAASNPLILPEDWAGIECAACHATADGLVQAELSWANPLTGYSEGVSSTTALCEKCHRDTETLRHARTPQGEMHTGYTCTNCHEPHSVTASCGSVDCHPEVDAARLGGISGGTPGGATGGATAAEPEPAHPGHDPQHSTVSCGACHDASGAQIAPDPETGMWVTLRTVEVVGRASTSSFQTHELQRSVDCMRCHFGGNLWELPELLEEGSP